MHLLELCGVVMWLLVFHLLKQLESDVQRGLANLWCGWETLPPKNKNAHRASTLETVEKDCDHGLASGFKGLIPLHNISDVFET